MIRKRLSALRARMAIIATVVAIVGVVVLLSWNRGTLQRTAPAVNTIAEAPLASKTDASTIRTLPNVAAALLKGNTVVAQSNALSTTGSCVAAMKDVLLVGNRPVGTYLCSYFPNAASFNGGCKLPCSGPAPFTCTILNMGSKEQLKSADVVVNHHGPVPTKFSALQPVMTLFYSGESNASEGKKALQSYQMKYDNVVSFHQHRPWYFTWTNRFTTEFSQALSGSLQTSWPAWDQRRNAVAIFVSRCKKGGRERVMQALGAVYPLHSFGKCHRTHTIESEFPKCAAMSGGRYPQKLCVFSQYKYILALDNTRELDYVTEKVYHAMIAGAVPIYDGAPNADAFLPGGWDSVIRLSDFDDKTGGTDYRLLQSTLKALEDSTSSKLKDLRKWASATSEGEWGEAFVDNLHHGEPTCDVCDAARRKKCGG